MKIKEVSKTYGRKIVVKFQPFEFSTTIVATPDKDELSPEEFKHFQAEVYALAKEVTEADIDDSWPKILEIAQKGSETRAPSA
jgi:hypothetical protein